MQRLVLVKTAILNQRDEVLLLQRSRDDDSRPGEWDYPGGAVEDDEAILEGGCREVAEEAGVVIHPERLPLVYAKTDPRDDRNQSIVRLLSICRVTNDTQVRLSHEHESYQWLPIDEALREFPHPVWGVGLRDARDRNLLPAGDNTDGTPTDSKILAKILVVRPDGKLLIVRRGETAPRRPLQWDMPGGHAEEGESIESAAVREMREECGIDLSETQLAAIYADSEYFADAQLNVLWIFFVAHVKDVDVALGWEHVEYDWATLDEAIERFEYPLHIDMLTYIRDHRLI